MKTSVIRTMITYIVLISLLAFAPGLAKWVEPGDIENTVKKELHGYEEKLIVFKEMFLNLHGEFYSLNCVYSPISKYLCSLLIDEKAK